ncbi:drug resistance protein [Ilyonectria robusta]|uniref:drug resistance protein n=1 Tax=Ilyonectria robusta TaxID=1079257 RepID=UPI001E8E595A|nr:drug resistance protein [Ilyonectria robusta]KAH8683952.1 drug resistance protein [Ilyonectria robusta]
MLPDLSEAVGIPSQRQQLVISIYNVSSGCLMLLWGRLADVYGRRLVFLISSALFTISTLCLGFATHEIPFYIIRAMQGLSGSAMIPSAIGIIANAFPPGKSRNRAYVTTSAAASLGSVLGSISGGVIGGFLSWKWVFWIPVILAAVTTDEKGYLSIDWIGGGLISIGLVLLLISLTQADTLGWKTFWIPLVIAVSVLILILFVYWQYRLEKSSTLQLLIRISMFRNLQFSALFVVVGCFYAAFNSFLVFVTFFYQDYLGLGVLDTTLRFLPSGIAGLVVSFAVSPALSRIPGFYILEFGLLCGLASPLLFAIPAIPPHTTYWAWSFPAMCLCLSVEVVWPVVGLFISEKLPQEDQALGGGLLQTVNHISRSLGLVVTTAIQSAVQGEHKISDPLGDSNFLRGLQAAQWTNVASAGFSVVVAAVFFRNLGRS